MTLVFGRCLAHSESLESQMGTPREEDIHVRYSLWALRLLASLAGGIAASFRGGVTCILGGCK